MNDTTYNGWTNYETWVTKLWIDNDQGTQEYWAEQARQLAGDSDETESMDERKFSIRQPLAQELESQHDEFMPVVTGVYADLLGRSNANINWDEIAAAMIDDLDADDWPMAEDAA